MFWYYIGAKVNLPEMYLQQWARPPPEMTYEQQKVKQMKRLGD